MSIPIAAEMLLAEVLFAGHVVFLVETLGVAWALVAFAAIWAVLGLAVLAATELLWPRVGPSLRQMLSAFTGRVDGLRRRIPIGASVAVGVAILSAAVTVAALMGRETGEWIVDHRGDVGVFLVAALIISAILIVIARLGRGLENWVRNIADTSGVVMRSFGALLSMMVLGPALSWPLFRLLRYSRRSVYALTLVAAPVFSAVWVPFYGLGVWALLQDMF